MRTQAMLEVVYLLLVPKVRIHVMITMVRFFFMSSKISLHILNVKGELCNTKMEDVFVPYIEIAIHYTYIFFLTL